MTEPDKTVVVFQSQWSMQDKFGSTFLVAVSTAAAIIGLAAAIYWASLSARWAWSSPHPAWGGFMWLAIVSAAAAITAPILWPYMQQRRPEAATATLAAGIVCWLFTSVSGALYLMESKDAPPSSTGIASMSVRQIEAELDRLGYDLPDAEKACRYGRPVLRIPACYNLNVNLLPRSKALDEELTRREHAKWEPKIATEETGKSGEFLRAFDIAGMLFKTAIGGFAALMLLWAGVEGRKAIYSEGPGGIMVPAPGPAPSPPVDAQANLIKQTFDAWADQCLQQAAGVTVSADLLYRHHCAFADWTKGRAHAGVETFGAAMSGPLRKLQGVRTEIGKARDTAYQGVELRVDGLSGQLLSQIGTQGGAA